MRPLLPPGKQLLSLERDGSMRECEGGVGGFGWSAFSTSQPSDLLRRAWAQSFRVNVSGPPTGPFGTYVVPCAG